MVVAASRDDSRQAKLYPKVHIAANLLVALRRGGFASDEGNGLNHNVIAESLLDRFTEPVSQATRPCKVVRNP